MKVMRRDSFSQRGKSQRGGKEGSGRGEGGEMLLMPYLQDGGRVARGRVVVPVRIISVAKGHEIYYIPPVLCPTETRGGEARRGATWSHAKNRAALPFSLRPAK